MLLAGDIGGTKTAIGIFSQQGGSRAALAEAEVHSGDYPSMESIAKEFLVKTGIDVDRACFGVAGAVTGQVARLTNVPWLVEAASVDAAFRLRRVRVINDLEALAYGVTVLEPQELKALQFIPITFGFVF